MTLKHTLSTGHTATHTFLQTLDARACMCLVCVSTSYLVGLFCALIGLFLVPFDTCVFLQTLHARAYMFSCIHTRSPLRESSADMPASTTKKKFSKVSALATFTVDIQYMEHFSALLGTDKAIPRTTPSSSASFEGRWGGQGQKSADVRYPRDLLYTCVHVCV